MRRALLTLLAILAADAAAKADTSPVIELLFSHPSFVAPTLPAQADFAGDSRIGYAFAALPTNASGGTTIQQGIGYAEWIALASENNFIPTPLSDMGIPATTSLNLLERLRATNLPYGSLGNSAGWSAASNNSFSILSATIGAGGSGYGASVTGTIQYTGTGSGCSTAPVLNVTTNSSGVITTVNSVATAGSCTSIPTTPMIASNLTGGATWTVVSGLTAGSGATFVLTPSNESVAPYQTATSYGGFPGYLTPGSFASPGSVTVTFGAAGSVSSTCGAGSGYTPFSLTDSNGDVGIPGGCVADSYSASTTYGGVYGTRMNASQQGAWANFTVKQPPSGARAQAGDTFTFTTWGPQNRSWSYTDHINTGVTDTYWSPIPALSTAASDGASVVFMIDGYNDDNYPTPTSGTGYGACPGPDYANFPSMPAVSPCLTLVSMAASLDVYKNTGKTVFLADETPDGIGTIERESHTVSAAQTTITTTNAATFLKDGSQFGSSTNAFGQSAAAVPGLIGTFSAISSVSASGTSSVTTYSWSTPNLTLPAGASVAVTGMTNTAANGSYVVTSSTATSFTAASTFSGSTSGGTAYPMIFYTACSPLASCSPGVGQYKESAGVYTISSSDPLSVNGGTAYLTYGFGTGTTLQTQLIRHAWMNSADADFVWPGAVTGCNGGSAPCDFHFPGALYNRPWVRSWPLFEALVDVNGGTYSATDPNCVSHTCIAMAGALDNLAVHPTVYGGVLVQQALGNYLAAIPAYAGLSDNTNAPTANNFRCAATGTLYAYSCTLPASMIGGTYRPTSVCYRDTSSVQQCVAGSGGTFTDANITAGTLNTTTGALAVTFSTRPLNPSRILVEQDQTNMLENGMLDFSTSGSGVSASATSCSGAALSGISNLPFGWTCSAASATGLSIAIGQGADASGYPAIVVNVSGVASAQGALTFNDSNQNATEAWYPTGRQVRSGLVSEMSAWSPTGTGKHLIGLTGGAFYLSCSSSAFSVPGYYTTSGNVVSSPPQTYFSSKVTGMPQTNGYTFTDEVVAGIAGASSGITSNLLSPRLDGTLLSNSGATVSQCTIQTVLSWDAGPVEGTWTFSRVQFRRSN